MKQCEFNWHKFVTSQKFIGVKDQIEILFAVLCRSCRIKSDRV